MAKTSKPKKYLHKSFYLNPSDQEMLEFLIERYGTNGCAVIRKLITEAYTILKYVEQKK